MTIELFASNAEFPACWRQLGLLEGEFFERQAAAFAAEYGASRPRGGTEHWRYGAFLHWLGQANDAKLLGFLLEAALEDPDPPMVGNVLIAIVGKPSCTQALFQAALVRVSSQPGYYISGALLRSTFENRTSLPSQP
jgi:hypothetical protein